MSVTFAHSGLPASVRPFDLVDLLWKLRSILGLQDVHVTYLRHMIRNVRAEDFLRGRICAVWTSPGKLADELQVSPRQLNRIEARLEEVGLILRCWGPNRRRFGVRAEDGRIVVAGGINLGPLVNRVGDLIDLLKVQRTEEKSLREAGDRANSMIKAIRGLDDADALEAARRIFPRLRPSEVRRVGRLQEIINALAAVLASFTARPGQTPTPTRSDNFDRPSTDQDSNIKTCTAPRPAATPPVRATPRQVVTLASDRFKEIIDLYEEGLATSDAHEPNWRSLCMAARELAQMHGISGYDWGQVCDTLGPQRAALALTVIDRNSEREGRWRVENVAGTLMGMVRAEAMGRAVLESLVGEALRSLSSEEA